MRTQRWCRPQIAENLARLGSDTRLLTAVGNDQMVTDLLEVSQRAGVDVRQTLVLDGHATSATSAFTMGGRLRH
ncbi:hypothetical protein ACTG2V_00040 [Aeromonas sp. 74A]